MNCQRCNKEFTPTYSKQKFCSRACGLANTAEVRQRRQTFTCEVCGASFDRRICEANQARYCSKACWSRRNPPSEKVCAYCGVAFKTMDRKARYCSRHCAGKDRTGSRAGAWKDGKSLERDRARLAAQVKSWRITVFIRDNRRCQQCGATEHIHAHHIKPWAEYPDLRFDVDNGVTLCEVCHGKVHGKDFSNRRIKNCVDCGASITGTGTTSRCRSCASKAQHKRQGRNRERPCQQCGALFTGRPDYKYCSHVCRSAAATRRSER